MKIKELLNTEVENAKLEMDPNGHIRVTFDKEELPAVNSWLKSEMDRAYEDWTPRWNDSLECIETYKTVKIDIPDSGGKSVYPAPIARIPADQRIAAVYNTVIKPDAIFSIDAYLNASYPVPAVAPQGAAGVPVAPVPVEQANAEEIAHRMEQGYKFILRERVKLPQKLLKGIRGAVIGSPYWWKVCADPEEKTTFGPKVDGATIDFNDKYEDTRQRGDIVKWYLVPYTNCMMPIDAESVDDSPWFSERDPSTPSDLAKQHASGKLFLIDAATAEAVASSTVDRLDEFTQRSESTTQSKRASEPIKVCDTWKVWFYRTVRYVDPQQPTDDKGKKFYKIKKLSLVGSFHRTSGQLLNCYLNQNDSQSRQYVLVDEMEDGESTVRRQIYQQTMFTYAAQSEIMSAHIANTPGFWHDPHNPDVADFFAGNKVVQTGQHVPGKKDIDWGTATFGEKHYSMLQLMQFFQSMSQLDSRQNDFTMGGRPPGRTSPNTVSQVYERAEETQNMFLSRLSDRLSQLLRWDMETRRQYQPLGEVLPQWNPQAKARVDIPFRFPVGDVMDNFRVALTAADNMLSQERDPQQIMMRKQALMQDGEYVAQVIGAILNLQSPLPPQGVALYAKIINRVQKMTRQLMAQMVSDEEDYDLTPELMALIAERNQAIEAQQSQPPQPPQPEIKISLSGQLTPEQEAAAAAQKGLGGMNAPTGPPNGQGAPAPAGPGPQQHPAAPVGPPPQRPVLVPHPVPSGPPSGPPAGPLG